MLIIEHFYTNYQFVIASYKNVYNQYCRWNKRGIFKDSFYNLILKLKLNPCENKDLKSIYHLALKTQ